MRQDFSQFILKVQSFSHRNNLNFSSGLQDPSLWARKLGAVLIKIMPIKKSIGYIENLHFFRISQLLFSNSEVIQWDIQLTSSGMQCKAVIK